MLKSVSTKPIVKTSGKYYMLSRTNHFLSSPIRSREMDTYNMSLPQPYYYPRTMLYTFDKSHLVDDFYMDVRMMTTSKFPRLETSQVKLTKGQIWLDIRQDFSNDSLGEFNITERNLDETLYLAKLLKSNVYVIHKYYCETSKIKLQGTFLPVLQKYIDTN